MLEAELFRVANKFMMVFERIKEPKKFKPIPLNSLLRPHPIWFLRRYQKRIFERAIILMGIVTFLVLIIKNWR